VPPYVKCCGLFQVLNSLKETEKRHFKNNTYQSDVGVFLIFNPHFSYIYLLTPWSRVLLEKLTSKLCS